MRIKDVSSDLGASVLSDAVRFVSALRRVIDQGQISRIAKYEILYVDADITVQAGAVNAFGEIGFLLEEPNVAAALAEPAVELVLEDAGDAELDDDAALDAVVEAAASSPQATNLAVPARWRSLLEIGRAACWERRCQDV